MASVWHCYNCEENRRFLTSSRALNLFSLQLKGKALWERCWAGFFFTERPEREGEGERERERKA